MALAANLFWSYFYSAAVEIALSPHSPSPACPKTFCPCCLPSLLGTKHISLPTEAREKQITGGKNEMLKADGSSWGCWGSFFGRHSHHEPPEWECWLLALMQHKYQIMITNLKNGLVEWPQGWGQNKCYTLQGILKYLLFTEVFCWILRHIVYPPTGHLGLMQTL